MARLWLSGRGECEGRGGPAGGALAQEPASRHAHGRGEVEEEFRSNLEFWIGIRNFCLTYGGRLPARLCALVSGLVGLRGLLKLKLELDLTIALGWKFRPEPGPA